VALPTTAHLALQARHRARRCSSTRLWWARLQPDGSFQEQTISPADHSIELRKGKTRSLPVRRSFAAGQTVRLTEADPGAPGRHGNAAARHPASQCSGDRRPRGRQRVAGLHGRRAGTGRRAPTPSSPARPASWSTANTCR